MGKGKFQLWTTFSPPNPFKFKSTFIVGFTYIWIIYTNVLFFSKSFKLKSTFGVFQSHNWKIGNTENFLMPPLHLVHYKICVTVLKRQFSFKFRFSLFWLLQWYIYGHFMWWAERQTTKVAFLHKFMTKWVLHPSKLRTRKYKNKKMLPNSSFDQVDC